LKGVKKMFERLKQLGDIEIPLSAVVVIVAITIIAAYQPQKEVHYVILGQNSQQIHGL
jgi:hypothetical protein